jgi:hypothetical protein
MKTYSLVVQERHAPFTSLRLVAPGGTTLDELARLIAREFELAPDRPVSFYRSGRAYDERTEFSSHGRSEHDLQGVRLDRLALRAGATLLHRHAEDTVRWHELRVAAVAEGEEPLEVVERTTPRSPNDAALAARVRAALAGPQEGASEEERRAWLDAAQRLALELLERGRAEIEQLGIDQGLDIANWLIDFPFRLAHAGRVDEAAHLAARAAGVLEFPDLLADRAVILAEAERADEARAQAAEVLAGASTGAVQIAKCGDVHRALGELARAEELYRQALPLASSEGDHELVCQRLVDLLGAQGRHEEARALELVLEGPVQDPAQGSAEEEDQDFLGEPDEEFGPELRPAARVPRNAPCPCGSGKKHKKCCGREGESARGELDFLTPGLHRALEHFLGSPAGESARAEFARFAGPAFEGLDLREALPLLPEEAAELAYLDWWLADREERPGATLLDLYLEKRESKLDPREARVLRGLGRSALGLYRIANLDPEHPAKPLQALDLLGGEPLELGFAEALDLGLGETGLFRFVAFRGRARAVHMGIPVRPDLAEPLARGLADRWPTLPRAERAPVLFQAWLDVLHAASSTSS